MTRHSGPPEPDLWCELRGAGQVAAALGRLDVDPGTPPRRAKAMLELAGLWAGEDAVGRAQRQRRTEKGHPPMPTNEDAIRRRLIDNIINALRAIEPTHRRQYSRGLYRDAELHVHTMRHARERGEEADARRYAAYAAASVAIADVVSHVFGIEARELINLERSLHPAGFVEPTGTPDDPPAEPVNWDDLDDEDGGA